jgi:hypothetical protein
MCYWWSQFFLDFLSFYEERGRGASLKRSPGLLRNRPSCADLLIARLCNLPRLDSGVMALEAN